MTERDIFLAVLDLPDPAARAAYIGAACGGDAGRRARVEALLQSHESAGSFLAAPVVASSEPGPANTEAFDATPRVGAEPDDESLGFLTPSQRPDSLGRIGHYEVLRVLGKGGFGIVFRAFDELLQRVVAVKVLSAQIAATSPARKRFLREARSSAKVRHENVVQVYAVEEQPLPYLVMEFIPGETLQQRLDREGPLEAPAIVRIGRQIAEGLAAAHDTGLIHRDIKPSNIMVDAGPQQNVKITDFGLARAADDAHLTQSGVVAGTPMYMSPEQAEGEGELDARSDLFSLGGVLYRMCTGTLPFKGRNTMRVLHALATKTPRPPIQRNPEMPQALSDLILSLLKKDPDQRPKNARALVGILFQ
jgi:serine/threonine protein kinase